MSNSTAQIPTQNASRYLQQLCKHWAHKLDVEFTPEKGLISFPDSSVISLFAHTDFLEAKIENSSNEIVAKLKPVLSDHLDRFAFREAPLTYNWTDGD